MKTIKVKQLDINNELPFTLIAGPCAMESEDHAMMMQTEIKKITTKLNIPFIFKTSFDKANRTSVNSKRGVGLEQALEVFQKLQLSTPVITDIHEPWHCDKLTGYVDMLQIPAFLCRQTDLLLAAGRTGLAINVKKGQFVSPDDMLHVIKKIESTGNKNIMLTERGTFFGYGALVVDFRSLSIMADYGYPVCMDATHSVQKPGGHGEVSGGDRRFIPTLARAGIVNSISSLFVEVHNNPSEAFSDGPNQIPLKDVEKFLVSIKTIDNLVKENKNDRNRIR